MSQHNERRERICHRCGPIDDITGEELKDHARTCRELIRKPAQQIARPSKSIIQIAGALALDMVDWKEAQRKTE